MRRSINPTGLPVWPAAVLVFGMLIEMMAQSIQGTAWNAVQLYGDNVRRQSSTGERQPYLVFGANGEITAADGCNRLTGPYIVTTTDITFGRLSGTHMACPTSARVAQQFRAALTHATHWRIVMGRLELYGATGKPIAIFEQRSVPPDDSITPQHAAPQLVKFQGSQSAP